MQEKELHLRTPLEELTDIQAPPHSDHDSTYNDSSGSGDDVASDVDVGPQPISEPEQQLPEFDDA